MTSEYECPRHGEWILWEITLGAPLRRTCWMCGADMDEDEADDE